MRYTYVVLLIIVCIPLIMCGGDASTAAPAAFLTASRTTITRGQSVTLSWTATNSKRVFLDGTIVMPVGTQTITPTATATHILTVSGILGLGSVEDTVTITVN
jgi:hypothetical protein